MQNNATITFRLPRNLKDALEARAAADHRKTGDVVRLAVAAYLRQGGAKTS